jgi:sugar O-acyltransferase (sialic acid O-acetyltransferase NeuD family)
LKLIGDREGLQIVAVLDDNSGLWGHAFKDLMIDGPIEKINQLSIDGAIVAIGNNRSRRHVFGHLIDLNMPLINAIHPSAIIAQHSYWGQGIVVCANAVVNIDNHIGDNTILNTACTIDHDCVLEAHVHIAPGVHVAGAVRIGEGTLVGIGSSIIPQRTIGQWVTVGAGSVVIENVPDQVTVAGVPARILDSKD